MNIRNQMSFIQTLNERMIENTDQGIEFFKEEWPKLDSDDHTAIKAILTVAIARIITLPEFTLEDQLSWLAIANYAEKPIENGKIVEEYTDDIFPPLELGEGINGNQLTNLFYELRQKGVIKGTFEQIAEALSIIFPIEYITARKDLTEQKRRIKIKPLP